MTFTLHPVISNDLFGCPLIETAQRALTTSKGIIQGPPRVVQSERKRGGMA
jgi:hypothetical protein